ncbi:S8 family serine peptidase [Candidatus Zixiibacteriota bacterium]
MKAHRQISLILPAMMAIVSVMLTGAVPQEPPTGTRLDTELSVMLTRMEEAQRAGVPVEIPLLARTAGVSEGPEGTDEPWVEIVIRGDAVESSVRMAGGEIGSRIGRIHTARVPLSTLGALAVSDGIEWIEAAMVCRPALEVSMPATGADLVHGSYGYKGAGVLIAIYDTGIDYTHEDFRNADGSTRIKAIWDQTVSSGAGSFPTGYAYGREWSEADINAELVVSPPGTVSEQDINGHGTHVAGIAAGNGRATGNSIAAGRHVGMAPEADILVIKGGDESFLSTQVMDGVAWAISKATALGQPIVINLSLGGHSGAHDGTSNYEMFLDGALGTGQLIVAAAGNEGGDHIHSQTSLISTGTDIDSFAVTVTYDGTVQAGTGNDYVKMQSWHDGTADVAITVRAPDGTTYGPVSQGGYLSLDLASGNVTIQSTSSPVTANEDHQAVIIIDDVTAGQEPMAGDWWIIYELSTGPAATVDAWIYEATFLAQVTGGDASYSVGMPATAEDIITVGAWVTTWSWTAINAGNYSYLGTDRTGDYAIFSSQGPTRDGRTKPEISAPGKGIFSSSSSTLETAHDAAVQDPDGQHFISQGTSQATPHVAGAIALMLQADATRSAALIKNLLLSSADTDGFTGSVPNQTWGYGKLDAKGAVDLIAGLDDAIGPSFTIGLLRNSVVTDFLDVYTVPSEALADTPLVRVTRPSTGIDTLGSTPIITSGGTIYAADYRLTADGTYTLTVSGTDLVGNDSTATRDFTAALVGSAGGTLVTSDGLMRVTLPSRSLPREGYVIACEALDGPDRSPIESQGGLSPAWHISPDSEPLGRRVRIEFSWDPTSPENLAGSIPAIHRQENGRWIPVTSSVDESRRIVEASVEKLGIYQLRALEDVGNSGLLHGLEQNYPNPFNGATQIRFTLARPADVEVFVMNVRGQRITTLIDQYESAGRHVVTWNGRGESGQPLASGIYLVAMKVEGRMFTRKVLLLQ